MRFAASADGAGQFPASTGAAPAGVPTHGTHPGGGGAPPGGTMASRREPADGSRIGKIPLVQVFDERGIAACDRRRRLKFLKKIRAHTLTPLRRKSAPRARRVIHVSLGASGAENRGIIATRGAPCCIAASSICVLPA